MDKQKDGDKKSNVKYQKLDDDSRSTSSSSKSLQSSYSSWFEKHFQRNEGPKYERLKEEEDEKQQKKGRDSKK